MVQTRTTIGQPKVTGARGALVSEKRSEARYPTNDAAEVQILPSNGLRLPATVIDISKSGLRLELETMLGRYMRIEVMITPRKLVIFGEVRYCRRSGGRFHAGILIEGIVFPKTDTKHIHDDQLTMYALGKGLTAPEVLWLKDHLLKCEGCVVRLAETTKQLRSSRRSSESSPR